VIKQTKKKQPSKETAKEEVKPKRKSTTFKSTSDALSSILNGPKSNGKAKGGEGNDNIAGDKGSLNGDLCEQLLWIRDGTGNGSGWGLNGQALAQEERVQKCNEFALS
jgi:hypothetical protein